VSFTIAWPQSSRLIPLTAQSIGIVLLQPESPATVVAKQLVARPPEGQGTTVVSFVDLAPGELIARVGAYPNLDGSGTPQATGQVLVLIQAGMTTSATLTMKSTVDRIGVSPTGPIALYTGDTAELIATAYDTANRIVLCSASTWTWAVDNESVVRIAAASPTATLTGVGDGTGTVTVTEGESGKSGQVSVEVVTPAPDLMVSPTSLDFGTTETQKTFTVSNVGTADLSWSCSAPAAASWVTTLSPTSGVLAPGASAPVTVGVSRSGLVVGTYTTSVIVVDNGGGGSRIVDLLVTVPNQPPVINTLTVSPEDVGPGGTATVTCSASDPDGDPLTYEWTASDGTITGWGASVTWTAPSPAGTYTITCVVRDGRGGTATQSVPVSVSVVPNHPPVINSLTVSPQNVGPGDTATVTCSASDPDGDPLTYEWTASDGTITGSDASVTWTAPPATGTYVVTCTVDDGRGGTATQSVPVGVMIQAPDLRVSPASLDFGTTETQKTFTVSNVGTADLSWSCSVPSGAAWVTTLSPTSGVLAAGASAPVTVEVSRSGLVGGTYTTSVVVVDQGGGGSRSVDLLVTVPNRPPVISSLTVSPQDVGPGGTATVTCSASDPDGDPLTYQWTAPGGTFTGSGASVTWTAPPATGTYVVTCTVDDGQGGTATQSVPVYVSASEIVIQ